MRLLTRQEYFQTAGLVVQNDRNDRLHAFPLRGMKIHGSIVDGLVHVKIEQVFETVPVFDEKEANEEEAPAVIMTHYQLPLDEQAAVTKFEAVIEDRVIKGIVKEKNQARQDFKRAVSQGKNAFLAEQNRPDIFRISVGNLPLGTFARVTVAYIAPLQTRGAANHEQLFVLPTAIAPRYEPLSNSEEPLPVGGQLIHSGVQISLSVTQNGLVNITSDTHKIECSTPVDEQADALVLVVDQDPLSRDIVIKMEKARTTQKPQVYFEESAVTSSSALMVSLVPDLLSLQTASGYNNSSRMEWIFVVDRSGSMVGHKMRQLRAALLHVFNEVLPRDAVFNIVSFGSQFEYLFLDGSKPIADERFHSLAADYITHMTANFGGTEVLKPLQSIFSAKSKQSCSRAIIVLTDGQVSNSKDVIEYVRNNSSSTRVFSIGIGSHASRLLVQGIARAGGGSADFVDGDSSEVIQAAVERQIEMIKRPSIVDFQMTWKFSNQCLFQPMDLSIKRSPYLLPPLVHGKPTRVYFLAEEDGGNVARPQALIIKGKLFGSDQDIEFPVELDDFVENKENEMIHKMTARELIRDLEESRSELHSSSERCSSLFSQVSREIVRIGVKYQIASSQTSFVAIDDKNDSIAQKWRDATQDHIERFRSIRQQLRSESACGELFVSGEGGGGDGDGPAEMDGVKAGDHMLKEASALQDKTQDSLSNTKNMIAESKGVGVSTLKELERQRDVIQNIEKETDRIDDNLARAEALLKQFGKRMATDSFIQCFAVINCLLLVGVILFAVIKKGGLKGSDEGAPESPVRMFLRRN